MGACSGPTLLELPAFYLPLQLSKWEKKKQPEGRTQLCLCPLLNIPLNISPKRRGTRYEEALSAFSVPRAGKQQPFPTPSLKGRAVSSLCAQNSGTPPPHTLSSRALHRSHPRASSLKRSAVLEEGKQIYQIKGRLQSKAAPEKGSEPCPENMH